MSISSSTASVVDVYDDLPASEQNTQECIDQCLDIQGICWDNEQISREEFRRHRMSYSITLNIPRNLLEPKNNFPPLSIT
ncbi:hypothetical protein O9G_001249 [Rozella allomycis CSF55]|uniref:Uncharacterized protein n=1 Tax=Rozella allomycis (strain CSF55) TaxID=988480 RepID=A0A075ATB6_ROZAC|nr:hypothetical protein O9G_001249 [Rozella allomycis CSF55]|eukprot:EPZ33498.1 hypothetical protein O9G_001249 [Rozella allomycis CSF55]